MFNSPHISRIKTMKPTLSVRMKSNLLLWRLFRIGLAVLCLAPSESFALEVYTVITNGCEPQTGLIVNTDDDNAYILNLEGELAVVKRGEIDVVLVYYVHDNPIKSLDLTSGLRNFLREVHVDDNENTRFVGWPIRFMEELIIFYDTEGKTHLVDIDRIKHFAALESVDSTLLEIGNFKPGNFGLGGNLPECSSVETQSGKITDPTRMISERIKVNKFFSVYNTGFALLKRFQRKTVFYAKPFLFEKATRLGVVYTDGASLGEMNFIIPLYFQWSNGSPYASQGVYSIGSKPLELLPSVEPHFAIQTDVKSHFFTGSFVGNAVCLSAGSGCVVEKRDMYSDFLSRFDADEHAVFPSFNYLALTGADYHEYSLSGGFYYPVYGILGHTVFREVFPQGSSPIIRFQRTTQNSLLRVIYSQTRIEVDSPDSDDIALIQANEMSGGAPMSESSLELIDNLESFDLRSQFLRLDFDYDITNEINLGISEIIFQGDYAETFSGEDYALDFRHIVSSLSLKQDFSDYITLKSSLNYFIRNYNYESENETDDSNESKVSFAISIEFLL